MPFQLIVFDLDGTVVDSLVDIAGALNHVLGQRGYAPTPVPVVKFMVGDGINMLVRRAIDRQQATRQAHARQEPVSETQLTDIGQEIWDHYVEHPCVDTRPFAGFPQVLTQLRARGCSLSVLTNKPGNVARPLLDALGLSLHFDAVIGDQDGFGRKPDTSGVRELMRRCGANPATTLIVGDGIPDVQVAHAVGARVAIALWGYGQLDKLVAARPQYLLRKPEQLLELSELDTGAP